MLQVSVATLSQSSVKGSQLERFESRLVTYQVGDLRQVLYVYALRFFTYGAGIIVVPASQLRGGVQKVVLAPYAVPGIVLVLCMDYLPP